MISTVSPDTNAPRVSGTEAVDDGASLDGSCQTHRVRLVGAHGFSRTLFIHIIQHFGVESEVAKHLTESYGDRAWTVAAGATAPQAAGVIHTDFERGFIRAEVASYDDFVAHGGELGAKEAGKLRLEGRDYTVRDGDVIHFRFNV